MIMGTQWMGASFCLPMFLVPLKSGFLELSLSFTLPIAYEAKDLPIIFKLQDSLLPVLLVVSFSLRSLFLLLIFDDCPSLFLV